MNEVISILQQTEHGFKHVMKAGNDLLKNNELDHFQLAKSFLNSEIYQARMLATYIFGQLSISNREAYDILKNNVSRDENWRVQEMLAKAFDFYCEKTGYENALPIIKNWLENDNPNVKRAVIEGLRIWTSRPFFKEHPAIAIELISKHKNHESEYLRKSIGNSLRDIRKKFKRLVDRETSNWNLNDKKVEFVKRLIEK